MRRKDKEITDQADLEAVIGQAQICHLGLSDNDQPYVVPMNFGYRDGTIYLHGALKGKKIEILQKNAKVCITFIADYAPVPAEAACNWGERFQSVIAFGNAKVLQKIEEKRKGLDVIMAHHSDQSHTYPDEKLAATAVIRIDIAAMSGKESGVR